MNFYIGMSLVTLKVWGIWPLTLIQQSGHINVYLFLISFLLQASSQTELDSWVSAVHSACAGSFARQHGKDNIVRLLRTELHRLENNIDIVSIQSLMGDLFILCKSWSNKHYM